MMKDAVSVAADFIRTLIDQACLQAVQSGRFSVFEPFPYNVEIPADTGHGDFACNIAMAGARVFKMAPRQIADTIVSFIQTGDRLARVEVAGPGFINFHLEPFYYTDAVLDELRTGAWTGRLDIGQSRKVMVEFVSANPTGPMHLGNARGGALGDSLAAVLDACSYETCREFYVNDAGNQVDLFGRSLEARYLQRYLPDIAFPDDGYHGDDITRRACEFAEDYGDSLIHADPEERRHELVAFAMPRNIAELRATLERYRIFYDVWFLESTLHDDGSVERTIDKLRANGCIYEKDGAIWYRATDFGGEKDEVLVKQNGFYTYFAVDIAYHYNKFVDRGFDRVINVWGADHHGHVARMKGAMDALGVGGHRLDIVLMQLVDLKQDGEKVRMSKRTGRAVTLSDLLEEVPVDAARFYFTMREYTSHFTFDLDLALKQNNENPVYYVQYAHARICSILKKLGDLNESVIMGRARSELLTEEDEKTLIRRLAFFPNILMRVVAESEPSHVTRYAMEISSLFHRFYDTCRVRNEDDTDLTCSRAALCLCVRQVLRRCLGLLKIEAPEVM